MEIGRKDVIPLRRIIGKNRDTTHKNIWMGIKFFIDKKAYNFRSLVETVNLMVRRKIRALPTLHTVHQQ